MIVQIDSLMLNVVHRGSGPVLLFVHGFPLDHQMWQGQIEGLAGDFTVIAPDLRGFGQSDTSSEAVPLTRYADDLADLLDAMGISEPVAFVGLSMGGYIAWQFWKRHRNRLSHMVLCDTRARADTSETARHRVELAERVLREGPDSIADNILPQLFSEHSRQAKRELIDATRQVILSTPPAGIATALHAMAGRPDATPWLTEIDVPSLLICGSEDRLTPPLEMRTIAKSIAGAQLVTIDRCGHMAPLEDPDTVNQAIRDFVG